MTTEIDISNVAIVGVGLLGGSVAMSLRRAFPRVRIVGVSRRQTTLDRALQLNVIDTAMTAIGPTCEDCDAVVVCTPVDRIADQVIHAARVTDERCLITDVGSTKAGIVRAVDGNSTAASKFVAAHPIAGSEKTGVQNASADLFDGKPIVLTPSPETCEARQNQAKAFWQTTGGQTVTMSPEGHDRKLAAISHVPHLVAALVTRLADEESLPLVGSGWRDITRVAAGDPEMWTAICAENRQAIQGELSRLGDQLVELSRLIETADDRQLMRWLSESQKVRQSVS